MSTTEGGSVKEDFFGRFQVEQALLQGHFTRIKDAALPEHERASVVDYCLSSISRLSIEVKDASSHLPAYDQRTYSTAIKTLTEKLREARSVSAPKRKFAFKKSGHHQVKAEDEHPTSGGLEVASPIQDPPVSSLGLDVCEKPLAAPLLSNAESQTQSTSTSTTLTISSLSSTFYKVDGDALRSVASVTDIRHSFIDLSVSIRLSRPFSTLAIQTVSESLIICGHVSGAVHVTGVQDSTLSIWSRQVRIHECRNCVVYLRCSSRPIIEDCHSIRFAPLPDFLNPSQNETAGTLSPNLWDQVDDFKWLRAQHSPNWSVLQTMDERAVDADGWQKIIAREELHLDLDDILRAGKVVE